MIAPVPSNPSQQSPHTPANNPHRVHRFVWGFGVAMVLVAGGGFGFKLFEFITVVTGDHPMNFSLLPVLTYLIVAAGYGCLFVWAYLRGQFREVEAPKLRMLEMQDRIDTELRREAAARARRADQPDRAPRA
jgi:hypothetical protein